MARWPRLFTKARRSGATKSHSRHCALHITPLEERCVPSTAWSQRGGDSGHTGYVDVAIDGTAIAEVWNQPIAYISSGSWAQEGNRAVAIDATRVYRTELDGYWANGDYHVMAYDLQTGELLWNRIIVGNGPVSAPSVGNDFLYVNRSGHSGISGGTSSDLPFLHAIDPATGATVLQVPYSAQWNTDERPAIDGNQVVSWNGYYGGMGSWNAATLTEQWRSGGSIYDGPKAAFDSQFIYAYDDLVYNRATGAFVREITGPAGYAWLDDPIVSQTTGRVFFDAQNDQYYPSAYAVTAYSTTTHTPLWTVPMPGPVSGKAVGNGMVAVTAGTQLFILDEATGAVLQTWQGPSAFFTDVILTRTHAIVQPTTYFLGTATAHAINLATGQSDWSYHNTLLDETHYPMMDMALVEGRLVLSHDGFVRAFAITGDPNTSPVAVDDAATTGEEAAVTVNVLANDSDVDGDTLIVSAIGAAGHGTIVRNADNTITYTSAANYSGPDSFSYTITDGRGGSDTATVTITVTPVNDVPVASGWQFGTSEDVPLSDRLRASDADGDALHYSLVTFPANGRVELNPETGAFIYTPDRDYFGSDFFSFQVNDATTTSNTAPIFISVRPVQDAPVAAAGADRSGDEGSAVGFDGGGSSDVDGDSLTYSWQFGDGGTASGPTPTHAYADNGSYTVTLTVNDGHGNSSTDTLLVTVNNVAPAAGASGPPSGVRGQARRFTFTANDVSTIDQSGSFTYSINWGDGSAVQQVSGTASVAVDHVFTASGTFTVQATATDKDGGTSALVSRSITLSALEMQGETLVIGGTTSADTILIAPEGTALSATINGVSFSGLNPTGRILVYAQNGDDVVRLQSLKVKGSTTWITIPAVLFGGGGNDTLDTRGSIASSVLVGGVGVDSLLGGNGQDLLLGGLGVDVLRGGGDDDILIGGTTDFDEDLTALTALAAEWGRTDLGYQERIDHLTGVTSGGLNGAYLLTGGTIHDDAAADQLYGEDGRDWFLFSTGDLLNDDKRNERTN